MRRIILASAATAALLVAMLVGPFGASAAAPFVYGCTPASFFNGITVDVTLSIYNGSVSTANLTTKLLAFDGTNLSALFGSSQTYTLSATNTKFLSWTNPAGNPATTNTMPATVRIVSDQAVAAGLSVGSGGQKLFMCQYLHP